MNKKELMQKALLDARAICEKAEKEKRDFTSDERTQVAAMLADAKRLKEEIKEAEGDAAMVAALMGFEGLAGGDGDGAGGQLPPATPGAKGSLGRRFVESSEFKEWMKSMPGGQIPTSMKGIHSPAVEFKDLLTGDSATSAGAFVETDYTGIYEPLGRYARNVLGLIARRNTGSDLVQFVRQTTRVQEAEPVPEANVTDYAGATGEVSGEKPEGALAFEQVTETVKTIAVWIPATKRALSDAAQIRGIIDQELQDDLQEELEDQILNGDGVGENFTGIFNTTGILAQAWDTDLLTTARKAVTTLQVTGLSTPTAWVINPQDWETIELLTDSDGRYYWGGPMVQGRRQLWSYPVVTSQAVTQGTGLLADWRKAVLWDRERASIQVSDSHDDFFIRNMVAILAELRAAFGLIRPSAFCEVELESGS